MSGGVKIACLYPRTLFVSIDTWPEHIWCCCLHRRGFPDPGCPSTRKTCNGFVGTFRPFLFVYINGLGTLRSRTESSSSTDLADSRNNDTCHVYPLLFPIRDFSYSYSRQHRARSSIVLTYHSTTLCGPMPAAFPIPGSARGPLEGV